MMSTLTNCFLTVLNMSYTACFVIAAVLLARLMLNWLRAPKIFSYALWAVVLFRLLCPISFASEISPLPSTEIISPQIVEEVRPQIHSGFAAIDQPLNTYWQANYYEGVSRPAGQMQHWAGLLAGVWLAGIGLLLGQSLLAWRRLRRGLEQAEPLPEAGGNIWQAAGLPTAFVLGLLRPQIYLPAELSPSQRRYVLLHEQAHLRRGDHLLKLLAFAALLLHWFNPLVWLAFRLGVQDMEMACDEAVLRRLNANSRLDYSAALLAAATNGGQPTPAPLAFSEGNVKSRIKNAASYRKPALWVILAGLLLVLALFGWLAANPKQPTSQADTVETLAYYFMNNHIDELNFVVTDSKITRLEQVAEFDNLLADCPVQVWALEYRLKPEDMSKVTLMDFVQQDGWIVESYDLGRHLVVILQETEQPRLLEMYGLEYTTGATTDLSQLAGLESAVRQRLEQQGLLPAESWPGPHAVAEFSLSDGELCRLLLSQPAKQGADGIWCVERWQQQNGYLHYVYPQADVTAQEYYDELQTQCDDGHQPWRLDALEVARQFVRQDLGQSGELTLLEAPSLADFYN